MIETSGATLLLLLPCVCLSRVYSQSGMGFAEICVW